MLLAGAFASLATSRPSERLDDLAEGAGFLLDAEHPIAHGSFSVRATAAASHGEITISLGTDALWVDTAKRGPLPVSIAAVNGDTTPSPWRYAPELGSYDCHGASCVGGWTVAFGPPDGSTHGTVRVDWSVRGDVTFGGDDVPEGAQIEITTGDLSGGSGPVGVAATGTLLGPKALPVIVEHLDIWAPAGVGERRELIFGRPENDAVPAAASSTVLVAQHQAPDRSIEQGEGVGLRTPDACRLAPCHIDLRLIVGVRPPGSFGQWSGSEAWVLEASPPLNGLSVTSRQERIPSISSQERLAPLAVHGIGDQASTGATISLPAVPRGAAAPIVFVQVSLANYASDWPSPSADSAAVELIERDGSSAGTWRGYGRPDPTVGLSPPGAVLTPRCRPSSECTVDVLLVLKIGAESNGPDAGLAATPVLRVVLLYPFAMPPTRPTLTIEGLP